MLKIRRVGPQERQLKIWQQQYEVDAVNSFTHSEQRYFSMHIQNELQRVNVLVHLEKWCQHRWPELAHYAWGSLSVDMLCNLFMFENKQQYFFEGQFICSSVEIIDSNDAQGFRLAAKDPHLGEVLLRTPFDGLTVREPADNGMTNIMVSADWVLGYSHIRLSLLRTLALGDALCIQQLQLHMSVAGRVFAQFQKQEEGLFMIEEILSPEDGEKNQLVEDYQDEIERPFDVADMSIKLTFVLGHSDIPVIELAHIKRGSVFSIGENKEREVKVYANKQLVAEGELIYLGDESELGLEITRIISLGDKRV
ncbi:FliM/FliN family flagellar motor switch protein [Providencia sp. Me31A]|uniref:FliM/FliN family flagellar motor switch protein n=1 Tax=Providencia sp. Me31A TaxID=3392637 RepID=UPI003D2A0158